MSRLPIAGRPSPARSRPLGLSLGLVLSLGLATPASHADPLPEDLATQAASLDAGVQDIKNSALRIDANGLALEEAVRAPAWQRATFYLGAARDDIVLESARLLVDGAEVVTPREFSLKEAYALDRRALFRLTTATMPLGPHHLRLEYVCHLESRGGGAKTETALDRLLRLPAFSLFGLGREEQREADRALTAQTREGTDTQRYPAARHRGPQPFLQGAVEGTFEKTAEPVDLEVSLGWDQRENRVGGTVIVWRPAK